MNPTAMVITLEARPVLSYAMAHNEIPVVSRLAIENVPVDLRAARLRLDVSDATGPIADSREILLDLQAGRPTVLTDLKLLLDPAAMLQVEEQRPGQIRARLEVDGEVVAEQAERTRVLAAQQWLAVPPALALEMLAAHVMPNHPAVTALMREVADRLQATTGSPSLEGYQSGPERVDQIVAAVYETLQAQGIRYAEPPASWADTGQKIRTPGEVLDGRVGTCLDTVVVMAAALEQAGVRPLLWIVDSHAFLGWWREESSLGTVAESDAGGIVNRVDLGQIGLVETTACTANAEPVSFADARRSPKHDHLTGDLETVIGVIDVHQARVDRIVPLPARTRDDDGQVVVTVYTPRPAGAAMQVASSAGGPVRVIPGRSAEPARVARWKNSLLDLSLRNRLINFTARSALSVVVPEDRLGLLEDLLHRGQPIVLNASDGFAAIDRERGLRHARDLPQPQLAALLEGRRTVYIDVTSAVYQARLRALEYKARTIVEETGANNFYLALGSLVWELDGRALRSPLILVPVVLKAAGRGGHYRLLLDEAGSSTPNFCLVEKLRQVHGLDIPGLADPATDDAGIDLDAAFEATRRAVAERGLSYHVEATADLAVLQFAKFRLWRDLDESWAEFAKNPLVAHLIHTPTDAFAGPVPSDETDDLDELDEYCPVPADSSQLSAVAEATAGHTFVLEGPPGTGKSQTITNLLTRAVAAGRRVLFVAEKQAALDVVQKRLDAVGMGPLSLDLHDRGSKPAAVRDQIRRALDLEVVADQQDHGVQTEALRSARRRLTRYAGGLHDPNAVGLSLYGARDAELAIGADVAPIPIPDALLIGAGPDTIDQLRRLFGALPEVAYAARPRSEHPWAFVDTASGVDVAAVRAAAVRFDAVLPALPPALGPALAAVRTPADLALLAEIVELGLPLQVLDESRTPRWHAAVDTAARQVAEFASAAHAGLDVVTPDSLAMPLEEIDAEAGAAASSGFFGRGKRLAAVADRLAPVVRPGATIKPKRLTELTAALATLQGNLRALADQVRGIPGLVLPPGWTPFAEEGRALLDARIDRIRRAGQLVDPARTQHAGVVQALRPVLATGVQIDPRPVREAATALHEFLRRSAAAPTAIAQWAGERGVAARWRETAAERALADPHLGSLRRWLDLVQHLEPLHTTGLTEARTALLTGVLDADEARRSFDLGLARASIPERLRATQLDAFDPAAHARSIERFVAASRTVRAHLATVVPHAVVTARDFDPRATGGRVGQLQRQLSAKRGGMKVRELMSSYGDLITSALPCVLVSPDSLARFFPARPDLFDIVVFDEASQVRVADAIGAMGRARSVVVVGDSKQMPPTSFAESAFAGDDVDTDLVTESVEDEESILSECVQARVPRHRLSWHYRSQDESLIAFSNLHYYDGGLASFPAPVVPDTGVSLVRVDGHFHRSGPRITLRTNPVEAEAVVTEIRHRFDASPDGPPSVGVVTFNQQQRTYIEGLLRDAGDQRLVDALELPDGLFVKNLENVQGDERDVIFFSTAFSVNDRGVLPLNFGPLNRAGGERRLNVAVTRARRQVVVYSSFDPAQLRTEETSSVGLRHLRSYLEMAATGPEVLPHDTRRRRLPDRHREQVAAALREKGIEVRTDVGLSEFALDLVLGPPQGSCVAVLLDGPGWASRRTARDRDALPQEVLIDVLGWPRVERVWLPEWLAAPDEVVARLVAATSAAQQPAASSPAPRPLIAPEQTVGPPPSGGPAEQAPVPVPPPIASVVSPVLVAPPPDRAKADEFFVPWTARSLGSVDVLDALPDYRASSQVAQALTEIVVAEGPIHTDRLAYLVARGFGLSRVAETRKATILRHLPSTATARTGCCRSIGCRRRCMRRVLERRQPAEQRDRLPGLHEVDHGSIRCRCSTSRLRKDPSEPVVWPPERDPQKWTGYRRTPDGVDRPVEHVPLREVVNAMVASTQASAGMSVEELHREVLAVFGGRRLTKGIASRLDTALSLGMQAGRLTMEQGVVRAPSPSPATTTRRRPRP